MAFGLHENLIYTEFHFDSFDCLQAQDATHRIEDWPLFYLGKPLENVAAIKILEAQIPFSYYVFNDVNNTFLLEEYADLGLGPVWTVNTVTINIGNYSLADMAKELGRALQAASNQWTYSICYGSTTSKFIISNNMQVSGQQFRLTFGDPNGNDQGLTNPRRWLGFTKGYNTSTVFPGTCTLNAPDSVRLTGPNYVYINSLALSPVVTNYLPGNGIVNPTETGADGPQIAKIPMSGGPGEICTWKDPDPQKWFNTQNINLTTTVDFFVTLGTDNPKVPVKFNGGTFNLKLGILQIASTISSFTSDGVVGGQSIASITQNNASNTNKRKLDET